MLLPGARADEVWCAPDEGSDAVVGGGGGESAEAARPGAVLGVPSSGRTGGCSGPEPTPGLSEACLATGVAPRARRPANCPDSTMRDDLVGRDTRPVTMAARLGVASRERWGRPDRVPGPGGDRPGPSGPRSSQVTGARGGSGRSRVPVGLPTLGSDHGDGPPGRAAAPACFDLLHTADVHLGARHADLGEAAAAQRERQFAAFRPAVDLAIAREGRPVPRRRRPVRLERPAQALGGARGRRARPARAGPYPLGAGAGHPRRLRPVVGLSRLRPRGHGRHAAGRRRWSPSSRRTTRGSTCQASTPSSTAPASRPSARPRSPLHDLAAVETPDATWQHRRAPRRPSRSRVAPITTRSW